MVCYGDGRFKGDVVGVVSSQMWNNGKNKK